MAAAREMRYRSPHHQGVAWNMSIQWSSAEVTDTSSGMFSPTGRGAPIRVVTKVCALRGGQAGFVVRFQTRFQTSRDPLFRSDSLDRALRGMQITGCLEASRAQRRVSKIKRTNPPG